MDNTRFKRRETQTGRQLTNTVRGGAQIAPRSARSMDTFTVTRARQPLIDPTQQARQPAPLVPLITTAPSLIAPSMPAPQGLPNRRLPISMEVPGAPSPDAVAGVKVLRSKWKLARRWMFRSTAIVTVLVIAFGGLVFSQGWLKARKVFRGGTTSAAALQTNVDPGLLKGEGDGRINVLLLGRGGGSHDAPDLTDTMLLASVDPVNHTATLLSIPRDFWVHSPEGNLMKINAGWETGKYKYLGKVSSDTSNAQATLAGFKTVDQMVESVLGTPIHYNVLLDFDAFKQAIDTIGGVAINVPEDLVDPTMAWENDNKSVLAKAGPQNFDGRHALIYTRSRETTSDFARSQRQRAVLLAIKDKVNSLGTLSNPAKLSGLANAFGDNVQTDLSINDATRLATVIKNITNENVNSIGLGDAPNSFITTTMIGDQSVVEPKAGLFNYSAIQNFVHGQLKDPFLLKEQAKIQIYNGTTTAGLASAQADMLKSYGYGITGTGNAPTKGYSQTIIVDLTAGKSKYTKHYLEQRYGVTAVTQLPDQAILPNGADFVIVVGNDTPATH